MKSFSSKRDSQIQSLVGDAVVYVLTDQVTTVENWAQDFTSQATLVESKVQEMTRQIELAETELKKLVGLLHSTMERSSQGVYQMGHLTLPRTLLSEQIKEVYDKTEEVGCI